jgi:predicted Rossmann fold nucleotide-binding protein DprA/Smf involved in DNA uptake
VTPETTRKPELPDGVSAAARTVYACFDRHPLSIEQLQRAADLPVSRLLGALSELELVGCLTILPDRNYYFKQDGTIHG